MHQILSDKQLHAGMGHALRRSKESFAPSSRTLSSPAVHGSDVRPERNPADDGFETLALIPARGCSRGIKNKNLINLGGGSLIAHSIRIALDAANVDRVIVSTESERIKCTALDWGAEVPFLRPDCLAADDSNMQDAIRHSLAALAKQGYRPDAFIVLVPTSPFRSRGLLELAVDRLREGYDNFYTVRPCPISPCTMLTPDGTGRLRPLLPTSEPRTFLRPYGLLTGHRLSKGGNKGDYVHHITNPWECIDIDDPEDLEYARRVLAAGLFTPQWR